MEDFIVYFIPLFIACMIGEAVLSAWHNRHLYDTKDTWINIAMGISSLLLDLLIKGVTLGILILVHQHAVFQISSQWFMWLGAFLLQDMFAYFMHLMEHKIRLLWAVHVNHHSSSKFNFSTAVRSSVLQPLYRYLFFVPVAWLGFDPFIVLFCFSVSEVYAFFLHTETIGKLGPLEWVMNTPSHHRVHHGMNEKYLDKNMGHVLIIWDRLFGTFQQEDEPVKYGLTKEFNSSNIISVVFHELTALCNDLKKPVPMKIKLQYLFNPPGKQPVDRQTDNSVSEENQITSSKTMNATSLVVLFIMLCSQIADAQPYIDVLHMKYQYFPATAYQRNTRATLAIHQLSGNVLLPLVLKNKDVALAGVSAESLLFQAKDSNQEKGALYALAAQMGYIRQWRNSNWKTMWILVPKISSDFRNVSGNDFQLGSVVLNTYQKTGKLAYKFGLYYNREFFGHFFMPLIGIDWQTTDRLRIFGVLPGSMNLEYQLNKSLYSGFAYQSINGSYRLSGTQQNYYVRNGDKFFGHNQLRVYMYQHLAKNIVWFAEIGHTLWRKFEVYDAKHVKIADAPVYRATKDNFLLNTGIAYRIRTNQS